MSQQVERTLPVASQTELRGFKRVFSARSKKNLLDGHLWLSVLTRPPRSRFTCVQRLTCVACVLFCTMLANIFVFNARAATDPSGSAYAVLLQVGSYRVTSFSLVAGALSALIVVPVNVLIVALFVHRGYRSAPAPASGPRQQIGATDSTTIAPKSKLPKDRSDEPDYFEDSEGALEEELKESKGWRQKVGAAMSAAKARLLPFPWFSHYVAYALAFASIAGATWAIVCFGGGLGEELATEWVVTMLISVLKSVLVIQPLKVPLLFCFISLLGLFLVVFENRNSKIMCRSFCSHCYWRSF